MQPIDPASLRVVRYPDPALRRRAVRVDPTDPVVHAVARRMLELMVQEEGIGLAAPQVGLPWSLFVVDVPREPEDATSPAAAHATGTSGPMVYVNPTLADPQGAPEPFSEGCLSIPGVRGDVLRPPVISIRATGLDGSPVEQTASGLLARCWQHEFDHLQGVLILDRFTQMSRLRNRAAIRDLERVG